MKRLTCLLIAVMLMLCGCTTPSTADNDNNDNTPTVDKLFDIEADYDAYSPAKESNLPVSGEDTLGHTQIGKILYILTAGGVYTFDTESGKGEFLFEISASAISSHGEKLYLFNTNTGEIFEYSLSGEKIASNVVDGLAVWEVLDFAVTENYFVIGRYKYAADNSSVERQIVTILRESYTVETEKELKEGYQRSCYYKDDKLLLVYDNPTGAVNSDHLDILDIKSGKMEKLRDLNIGYGYINCIDICCNTKAETAVLVLALDNLALWEFSLNSEENTLLDKMNVPFEDDLGGKYYSNDCVTVSVYESVISVVCSSDNRYRWFDYLNSREYITVTYVDAMGGSSQSHDLYNIVTNYELVNDIIVRLQVYSDEQSLNMKLLAGDEDIDIYSTAALSIADIIKQQAYVDLNGFDGLADKISGNVFTDFASKTGSAYFGLPYGIFFNKDKHLTKGAFNAIEQYCIKNIDSETGEYLDPDGSELLKVLKYHYENPQGSEKEFYDFPYSTVQTEYLIINPASKKQTAASDFIGYVFDIYSGSKQLVPTLSDNATLFSYYPELKASDDVYLTCKVKVGGVVPTIYSAYHAALETDGSNSELKKLAKEAARAFRMRLNG